MNVEYDDLELYEIQPNLLLSKEPTTEFQYLMLVDLEWYQMYFVYYVYLSPIVTGRLLLK